MHGNHIHTHIWICTLNKSGVQHLRLNSFTLIALCSEWRERESDATAKANVWTTNEINKIRRKKKCWSQATLTRCCTLTKRQNRTQLFHFHIMCKFLHLTHSEKRPTVKKNAPKAKTMPAPQKRAPAQEKWVNV